MIQPPGPIDNTDISDLLLAEKRKCATKGLFFTISKAFWHFLHSVYGGGPTIVEK